MERRRLGEDGSASNPPASSLGVSPPLADRTLAHHSAAVTEIYAEENEKEAIEVGTKSQRSGDALGMEMPLVRS